MKGIKRFKKNSQGPITVTWNDLNPVGSEKLNPRTVFVPS